MTRFSTNEPCLRNSFFNEKETLEALQPENKTTRRWQSELPLSLTLKGRSSVSSLYKIYKIIIIFSICKNKYAYLRARLGAFEREAVWAHAACVHSNQFAKNSTCNCLLLTVM